MRFLSSSPPVAVGDALDYPGCGSRAAGLLSRPIHPVRRAAHSFGHPPAARAGRTRIDTAAG
jgi:hypothetical protein